MNFFFEFKDWSSKIKPFLSNQKILQNLVFHLKTWSPLISIFFRLLFRKNVEIQQFTFEILKINSKFQSLMF